MGNLTKRYTVLAILAFVFSIQCFAQVNTRAIQITSERNNNGDIVFYTNNSDYCDYYVIITFNDVRGYTVRGGNPCKRMVRPGKQEFVTLKKEAGSSVTPSYNMGYRSYRGNIKTKLNLDYIYPLPVKAGEATGFVVSKSNDYEMIFNLRDAGDTVYACRAGRVCDNELTDITSKSQSRKDKIIISHNDQSFSEYSSYTKSLVYPGDYVSVGQPIAVVKSDDAGKKWLSFSIFYLDENKVKTSESSKKHSSLVPVFHTANKGDLKLEEKKKYVAELTDELITQEMSKKEKAKFEKNNPKK